MRFTLVQAFQRSWKLCLVGTGALALLTIVCFRLHALPSVAALLYMVIIVVISLQGRFIPAIFVSLVAIGGLDYFFIAPVFRIMMVGPLDLAALVAYLTTAIVITSLLARLRRSVRELRLSEARLAEGERLSRTGS